MLLAMPERQTDDDLLLAGDAASFGAFYRRHVGWVLGFLARRTRDPELAADLCAETFAAALLARERYTPRDGDARSWLFRIAQNKLNDALRRGYAEDRARRRLGMERVELDDADLIRIGALGDDEVSTLLDDLPDDQRDAVVARVVHEHSYEDIAARAGVAEPVARKRVSRGLATLRKRMGGRT
jgi:RNA polymerase sigma factor (sigma-70 family)